MNVVQLGGLTLCGLAFLNVHLLGTWYVSGPLLFVGFWMFLIGGLSES